MQIGALKVELFISNSNSLKDKRAVIKALKERIRNNFNVSIAEVDSHDKWQKAIFGIAAVAPDKSQASSILNNVLEFIRHNRDVHIVDSEMEIL